MKKLLLLLITSILFFASCSNRNAGLTLDDVASYIQERPDSALAVLNKLPKDKLNTSALKARYSLLNAMALDKNYIDTTDVAVIMPALEYYKKRAQQMRKCYPCIIMGAFYIMEKIIIKLS